MRTLIMLLSLMLMLMISSCGKTESGGTGADTEKKEVSIKYYISSDGITGLEFPMYIDAKHINNVEILNISYREASSGQVYTYITLEKAITIKGNICPTIKSYFDNTKCQYSIG